MSSSETPIKEEVPYTIYGDDEDDEVLPEDLYYRDITAKIRTNVDEVDDIENLHENVPIAPPQQRQRPEIIPEPVYAPNAPADPSDTPYGANTNTYTTDDNTTYPNPALHAKSKASGSCGDDCGCDESKPQPVKEKGGCGDACGCDEAAPAKKEKGGCGDDCGCDESKSDEKKELCGDACGCGDVSQTPATENGVQTFGNYATALKENPDNISAPIKASTRGAEYDSSGVSNIPGLGVVYIKTWGCSHNTSDGEYMAGLLSQAGYTITNDEHSAQIWIANSCSVKGPSENSFFNELKRGRSLGKGVVVAGCVPQAHPSHPLLATYSGKSKALSGMKAKKVKRQKIVLEQQREQMKKDGKSDAEIDQYIESELLKLKEELVEQQKKQDKAFVDEGVFTEENQPANDDETPYAGVVSILGTDNIHRVVEVVEATLQGHSMSLLHNPSRHRPGNDLALPKIRKNPFVEIISINTGCLNNCTYCKTKHARGNLRSYPIPEIVERVEASLKEGVIEIWLTSEDLGAYGIDIGVRVHHLVDEILKVMVPGTMLRMGMSNPPYFKDILEPMYSIFHHPNCYEFLHIPVQAGADPVLNEMKRDYTNFEFQTICDELLKHVPTITLATDFICGFPTETDEDWKHSVALVEKYQFPVVFINQFYPRPGTPAQALPQLPAATLKARSKELVTLFNSYNTRAGREGEIWDVLVTDMSRDGDFMVAHTKRYDQVLIPVHQQIMGKSVKVKITQAEKHYFMAELVPGSVEEANKVKTTLPMNYKYWQFAPFIDSNIDSFVAPALDVIAPADGHHQHHHHHDEAKQPVVFKKSTTTAASVGIDDDELSIMTKRGKTSTQVTEAPAIKAETKSISPPDVEAKNTPVVPLVPQPVAAVESQKQMIMLIITVVLAILFLRRVL